MFTRVVVKDVGRDCPNLPEDVALVAELLGNVPVALGGPAGPLGEGGGTDLTEAVERFQQHQFRTRLGRVNVDSATYYRLLALQRPGLVVPQPNSPRVTIAAAAAALAAAGPISDDGRAPLRDRRKGWELLKQIFDESVSAPMGWADPKKYPIDGDPAHDVTLLDGVRLAGARVPQRDQGGLKLGVQWCGIFAAWVWQKATGLAVQWRLGDGPLIDGRTVKASTKAEALAPGDIAVRKYADPKKRLVHHFLVHSLSGDGEQINTVNGNSDYQRVLVKQLARKDVAYFYSVDTLLRAGDVYGPFPVARKTAGR